MSDQQFERAVQGWLDDGSDRTSPAAIQAVLFAVKTTPQERDLRIPRRFNPMLANLRLAAAVAIVAIVGVGVLAFNSRSPGVGGTPTPSPAPSATGSPAPTDPPAATPGVFSSDRYGYTVGFPGGIHSLPSQQDWTTGLVAFPNSAFLDRFSGTLDGQGSQSADTYLAGIASQPLPEGMSGEEWTNNHIERNFTQFGAECGGRPEDWVATSVAGATGRQVQTDCGEGPASVTEIVFAAEGIGWIITGDTALVEVLRESFRLPG